MRRNRLLLGLILAVSVSSCDGIPERPDPPRLVNDFARILSAGQVDSLERVLVDFDNRTSNQICVVSVKTLGEMAVDEYGLRLANDWGIGSKERQNGVLLLIKPRGRSDNYIDVTIQVGRGLEGAIPDAYASRIIRNVMGPYLKRDQYWPAITKACENLMGLATGEIKEPWNERIFQWTKSGVKSKVRDILTELALAILGILGLWLFIWIVGKYLNKHINDDDFLEENEDSATVSPVLGPNALDVNDADGSASPGDTGGSHDSGGFGGFGGGGFGGGGASGRF